ncbi:uncharacterized protein LOC108680309 [Hyalella azteca]|uniref:Uncharacterized protein LOC108680309 n=1 Tax=Hyalella azteca TaxID=294128 RepID=A0A8B7PGA2_HYAAZ|nr:uncharacterized protein LOC108680309 [Hyalella azteca]
MPCLRKCCCCCCGLREGSLAIGIISLVGIGLVEIAIAIYCLINVQDAKKKIKFENAVTFGIVDKDSDAAAYIFFSMLLLVAVIYVIVCLVLIHGVRNKKRFLLLPWAFFTFMNMIMAISGGILTLINSHGYALNVTVGCIVLAIASVWIYFTCVVFSFFQALQDGDYW